MLYYFVLLAGILFFYLTKPNYGIESCCMLLNTSHETVAIVQPDLFLSDQHKGLLMFEY